LWDKHVGTGQIEMRQNRRMTIRSLVSVLLGSLGAWTGFQPPLLFAQAPAAPDTSIRILVMAGQNGANSLKTKTGAPIIVEVRDANNHPVPAAVVTFTAPDDDPSLIFSNGSRSQSLITEVSGRVSVTDMEPVGLGAFKMMVTAAYDQHSASATISQENVQSASGAASAKATETGTPNGMSGRTKFAIIGAIAVAAGVGIAVALTHGKSSPSSTSTIGTGTPTVGAPH
jgi:hypothetical protein